MTYDDDVDVTRAFAVAHCECLLFFLPRKSEKTFIVKMPPGILKLQPRNIALVRVV